MAEDQRECSSSSTWLESIILRFEGGRPDGSVLLVIRVGEDKSKHVIRRQEPLSWNGRILCRKAVPLTFKVKRQRFFGIWKNILRREVQLEEMGMHPISEGGITLELIKSTVNIEELSKRLSKLEKEVDDEKEGVVQQKTVMEKLGWVHDLIVFIHTAADAASDLHPAIPAANFALEQFIKACEEQEKCRAAAEELLDDMGPFLSLAGRVPLLMKQEETRRALERVIQLIIEVTNYMHNYYAKGALRGFFSTKYRKRVEYFKGEYEKSIKVFDRGVVIEANKGIQEIVSLDQERRLDSLCPEETRKRYDDKHICLEGTRTALIEVIKEWIRHFKSLLHDAAETLHKLFLLHGLAGSGKSSVANTIAALLEREGFEIACFFCKRDDTYFSDPKNLFPSLAFWVSQHHAGYRAALLALLENAAARTDALHGGIARQFELLFANLVGNAGSHIHASAVIIIVDALDECGKSDDQKELAHHLGSLARLTPWIKVFITSRPVPHILELFKGNDYYVHNIHEEKDTDLDIERYIRDKSLSLQTPVGLTSDEIGSLVKQTAGLFIWCSTLFKYVGGSRNPSRDLRRFLSRTVSDDPLKQLYQLYDQILNAAIDLEHADDSAVLRVILGIVYVTADNGSLSVGALSAFVSIDPRFADEDEYSIRNTIMALHAVLYEDKSSGGVVRVLHPSFLDFIQQKIEGKVTKDWESFEFLHQLLFKGCMTTLQRELKFNICELKDSSLLNKDVPNLHDAVSTHISEALQYSSLFWSTHLSKSGLKGSDEEAKALVSALLTSTKALFWLEVLSLLNVTGQAVVILQEITSFYTESARISNAAADLERFVLAYAEAFQSTSHIYLSALAWLPGNVQTQALAKPFAHLPMINENQVTWEGARWVRNLGTSVNSVAFSSNGNLIAAGSGGNAIHVWNAHTLEEVYEPLKGHRSWVRCVVFSPDYRFIASGSGDKSVRLWNVETGENVKTFEGHSEMVLSVAFSPNGQRIASASADKTVRVWDVQSGHEIAALKGHTDTVYCVSFSTDGERIISSSQDNTVRIWNVHRGEAIGSPLEGHSTAVRSVSCSRDGRFIASGSDDGTMRIWDARTGMSMREPIKYGSDVNSVAFSTDSTRIVSGCEDGSIHVWDVETGKQVCEPLKGHTKRVWSVVLSPDGRSILSGSEDGTIRIWDIDTAATADEPLPGHSDPVYCVAFSPNGELIASASRDKTVRLWNASTGAAIGEPLQGHLGGVNSVAFAPNGEWVVSGSDDTTLIIWEVRTGAMLGEPLRGHDDRVKCVAVSSDSQNIASGSDDNTVRIWSKETRDVTLIGHTDWVISVTFLPDAQDVVSGSDDRTIRVWNIHTGKTILEPLTGHEDYVRSVAVSPDGRYFASGSKDKMARIWDASTGAVIHILEGHSGEVRSIAFSADSRYVISGSDDRTIRVWNVETGESVCDPLKGHSEYVFSVAFSPDGQQIVSSSWDETIRMWDARFGPGAAGESRAGEVRRAHWITCCHHMDLTDGWVKDGEKLMLWIPQRYRKYLKDPHLHFAIGDSEIIGTKPEVDSAKLYAYTGERWTGIYQE